MKDQLLNAPIGSFSGVHLVSEGQCKLVGAGELLKLASRAAYDSKHLAVERNLEDSTGEGTFSHEKHLVGARCDADGIGGPNHGGQALAGGSVAIDGAGARARRHVDGEHAQKR